MILAKNQHWRDFKDELGFPYGSVLTPKVLWPQEAHVSQQVITQQWDMKDTWQDMKDTWKDNPPSPPATPTKMIVHLSPLQIN